MIKLTSRHRDYLSDYFFEFFIPALVSLITLFFIIFLFLYAVYAVDQQSNFKEADSFIQECLEGERYTMDECVAILEASE